MKIFKQINIALLIGLVGFSSCCSDILDVEPSDAVPAEGAIKTVDDVINVRTGMYQALKGTSNLTDYYSREIFFYGDVRGEDVQYNWIDGSSRASFYYYMNYKTADDFSSSTAVWESPFIVISRANQIIENADKIEGAEQYVAEAKVLRALATFDLTRIYGKPYTMAGGPEALGAPIITKVLDPSDKPSRATVEECYTQVIKDLTEAIESGNLMLDVEEGYMSQYAAEALLARVYLTKGDYTNAFNTAVDVLNNQNLKLWDIDGYVSGFDKNSSNHLDEMLFEIAITNSTDWTDREGIAYCMAEESDATPGYNDVIVTKKFVDLITSDPNDVRNNVLLASVIDAERGDANFGGNKVYINKMPPSGGDVRYANVPILRLSEVYLIAAEAALMSGNTGDAADYLNKLIQNRTTDTSKLVDASSISLDRIKIERRKELVGEGQRYFDILRYGDTVTRYDDVNNRGWHDLLTDENCARVISRDSKKALPLIPADEINANPNMQQNPLY